MPKGNNQYTGLGPVFLDYRFWSKVQKTDSCWLWIGASTGQYGVIWIDGRNELAHRAAWMMQKGDIPADKFVCHECDNTLCVNVDHLFLGTARENTHDMFDKGRGWVGRHYNNTLDEETVKLIKAELAVTKYPSPAALGRKYNISRSAINDIRFGRTWRNVEA